MTKALPPQNGRVLRRALVVCDQWLGSDGYAGMNALRRAGWDVHVVAEREFVPVSWRPFFMKAVGRVIRPWATREFNKELKLQAARVAPEFLLVFKGRFVLPSTLLHLRSRNVRCYCFYPDVSFRAHGPLIPRALPNYDWIFTTKSFGLRDMREQLGVTNASVMMFAFDPMLHHPVTLRKDDAARLQCDVSYIGTWSPKKEQLLAELVRRRPVLRFRIWGEQWHKARTPALAPVIGGREVVGGEFVGAVCASAINLSIMSERRAGASSGDLVATRTFSVPACGAFVIHERTQEVLELFKENEEIVCYSDVDELLTKIDTFIADPARRRKIAERGREVVLRYHSWDARIWDILAHHGAAISDGAVADRARDTAPPVAAASMQEAE